MARTVKKPNPATALSSMMAWQLGVRVILEGTDFIIAEASPIGSCIVPSCMLEPSVDVLSLVQAAV